MKTLLKLIIVITLLNCNNEKSEQGLSDYKADDSFNIVNPRTKIVYEKLNFGNGYNSATGNEFFGVLEYQGIDSSSELSAKAKGNSGSVRIDILESKDELKKTLEITKKVDLDLKIYGFTSKNTYKSKVYNETKFTDFQQNAVIKAEYINEPLVIVNPKIKQEWIDLAIKNPDQFMKTCGDMFVSRIYTGGELFALFSLHNRDEYEKQQNETFFKSANSYLGNKLSIEQNQIQIQEKFKNVKNINTEIFTRGGNSTPTQSTLDSFVAYANEFKEEVSQDKRSIVLFVELSPYESIAGFPENVNFDKIRIEQNNFLEYCISKFNEFEESIDNANFVFQNLDFFDDEVAVKADSVLSNFPSHLTDLKTYLLQCESDFNNCQVSKLEYFRTLEKFDPIINYPEISGIRVKLPVNVTSEFIKVFDDTGEGKILSIEGQLESRLRSDRSKVDCKDVTFSANRSYYGYVIFGLKGYEYYEKPHYIIRYSNAKTGTMLREFRWEGTPVETEKNVKVEVRLVNNNSRLQIKTKKGWQDIGRKQERNAKFSSGPKYIEPRECNNEGPTITFSDITSAPKVITKNIINKIYSNAILSTSMNSSGIDTKQDMILEKKGGYLTYKYDK